jgi:hypothetical protein
LEDPSPGGFLDGWHAACSPELLASFLDSYTSPLGPPQAPRARPPGRRGSKIQAPRPRSNQIHTTRAEAGLAQRAPTPPPAANRGRHSRPGLGAPSPAACSCHSQTHTAPCSCCFPPPPTRTSPHAGITNGNAARSPSAQSFRCESCPVYPKGFPHNSLVWQLPVGARIRRRERGSDVRSAAVTNPAIFVMFAQSFRNCITELASVC